jgi:hypothetical protein
MQQIKSSVDAELKETKSDSLKNASVRIDNLAKRVYNQVDQFSTNLSAIKTETMVLDKFREMANYFSKDRDLLNKEIVALEKFQKQNERALLRSDAKKELKQEIANELIGYATLFATVAQKAITDFATLDAALFRKEKAPAVMPSPANPATPTTPTASPKPWVRRELPTEPIPLEEINAKPMVTPALQDMPKKESSLMKSNDEDFIKQRSNARLSEILERPASDTWSDWNSESDNE